MDKVSREMMNPEAHRVYVYENEKNPPEILGEELKSLQNKIVDRINNGEINIEAGIGKQVKEISDFLLESAKEDDNATEKELKRYFKCPRDFCSLSIMEANELVKRLERDLNRELPYEGLILLIVAWEFYKQRILQ